MGFAERVFHACEENEIKKQIMNLIKYIPAHHYSGSNAREGI